MAARHTYNDEQVAFLKEGYRAMTLSELTAEFNRKFGTRKPESAIRSACKNRKFKNGRRRGLPAGAYYTYTREQADFIKSNYKHYSLAKLTEAFNERFPENIKTVKQLRSFTRNHSVKSGRTGQFEKGTKSWNKGTKGVMKRNKTSFKKGSVPANIKPIGHERICSKDGYVLIKINEPNPYTGAPTRYKLKHQVVWEAAHGPVPEGHMIRFIDGDRTNCELENLEVISRNLNARLNQNGYTDAPEEVKPTIRAIAQVTIAARELSNVR